MGISLYLITFLWLLSVCFYSFNTKKENKKLNNISCFILFNMLCFRYGQGTDYAYIYNWLYDLSPKTLDFSTYYYTTLHSEFGWKLICNIFNMMGIPFEGFSFVISAIEFFLIYRFIVRYSKSMSFSLFLSYSTLYLIYMFSVMRQGLVMCIFVGILFNLLIKKKYISYVLITLLCTSIHTLSLIFLLVPFVYKFQYNFLKIEFIVSLIIGLLFSIPMFRKILSNIISGTVFNGMLYYLNDENISFTWYALAERLIIFIFLFYLYSIVRKRKKLDDWFIRLFSIYTFGISLYMIFLWNGLIATRVSIPFKILEIIIIPYLFENLNGLNYSIKLNKYLKSCGFLAILLLNCLTYYKNINSFIDQLNYYDNVNVFNYPYISIFNKDDVADYRPYMYGKY